MNHLIESTAEAFMVLDALEQMARHAKKSGPTDPDARPVREVWRDIPTDAEPLRFSFT